MDRDARLRRLSGLLSHSVEEDVQGRSEQFLARSDPLITRTTDRTP